MNVICYHNGALGDFISILPSIYHFQKQHTISQFTFLTKRPHGELANYLKISTDFKDINSYHFSFLFDQNCDQCKIDNFFRSYDLGIFFAHENSPIYYNVSKSNLKIIRQNPFPDHDISIYQFHNLMLNGINFEIDINFISKVNETSSCIANQISNKSIFLHPGSGSLKKNWPFSNFLIIAKTLRQKYPINWIIGECEELVCKDIPESDKIFQNLSLPEIYRTLQEGILYIGNDSGISHLAAITGIPTIALFGPSNPNIWKPYGENVSIVTKRVSDCFSCHTNRITNMKCEFSCINRISVEDVLAEVKKYISI